MFNCDDGSDETVAHAGCLGELLILGELHYLSIRRHRGWDGQSGQSCKGMKIQLKLNARITFPFQTDLAYVS